MRPSALLAALLALGAPAAAAPRLTVAASFYPIWFFASSIGGRRAAVFNVTPAGAEPHDYEPTARDVARIEGSGLFLFDGVVEPWGERLAESLKSRRSRSARVGFGDPDPHVWLSARLAERLSADIERAMAGADAADAPFFAANERLLHARLEALDGDYRRGLARCAGRDIVVSHAAFGYLAAAYGLRQVAILGLSPDSQPSPRRLAGVVDFARQHRVTTVFFEPLVSPKLARTVAGETGATALSLDSLEATLPAQKDYFARMRANLAALRTALRCR
ncbi:MAG: zinc ABC transporter substrate-binding protein [Elusimicrobia bacterium]|nr:zinc ABC transporter substrate-binding protein [Elusimicrobiota bacterium]MDE2237523.1 zinc ABC transporter substrate-binding protein [Elusimicrobiota bacterium]MDE2425980.1 zinc ABC transporter substrate-binding protein [Elusimicrobiota bacterium]